MSTAHSKAIILTERERAFVQGFAVLLEQLRPARRALVLRQLTIASRRPARRRQKA